MNGEDVTALHRLDNDDIMTIRKCGEERARHLAEAAKLAPNIMARKFWVSTRSIHRVYSGEMGLRADPLA